MTKRLLLPMLLLLGAGPLSGQALTLSEALRRADSAAFPNRMARAASAAASARAAGADQGVLPGLRAELGAVRTSDPLGAFGFLLRQRGVTPEAFDPAGLNRPTPRTDIGAAMVAEVPLLNLDAWAGRRAARAAADAESAREQWSATGVELEVIRSYFGAVLAREQARVLAAADLAGQAHVRRAENALANGLVTRSDLLLAQVRLGDIATQRLRADADAMLARQQLALVLGTPNDTAGALPSRIPGLATREIAGSGTRADLSAIAAMVNAASQEADRRSLALLPRVNGFGRYEWHDASSPLAGKPMWTVGVMATWAPFSGGAELAARREARANATAARAGLAAAQGAAALELASAESGVRVAEQALAIATRGTAQAAEAHRIVVRKYDGGLATVAELLDAQATDLGAQLGEAKARHDLIVAIATVARLRGSDLSLLAQALDASATNPE